MQKKTKSNLRLRDLLVVLCSLSVALFFAMLFWKDLNRTMSRSDRSSIATISFKNRIAQRKFDNRVVWERIGQNSPVYSGDIIRTADLSEATIYFDDGTTLELYENSMIQISFNKDGGLQIAVDGGDIQLESGASSSIALTLDDGSAVTVDAGASVAAKAATTGARSLEVKGGTAHIATESGHTASLAMGESVSVEQGGILQKRPITVTSVPKELRVLNLQGGMMPVNLAWTVAEPSVASGAAVSSLPAVVVQTSRNKDFSALSSSLELTASSTDLLVDEGVFYWRVFGADSAESAVEGKIIAERVERVMAVSPAEASELNYRSVLPRVDFRWEGNQFASRYRLVVSATPDMRTQVAEVETGDTFASFDTLSEGSYWWQVTPFYALNGIGYAGESAVSAFRVVRNEEIKRPELASPADGAVLSYREEASVPFLWKSDVKEAHFELVFARDSAFSDIAASQVVTALRATQRFDAESLGDGTYFWKIIRHSDEKDDLYPESAVRSFSIAKYVPKENRLLFPPDAYRAERAKISTTAFMWNLSDDYRECPAVLQVALSADDATEAAFASPALEMRIEDASSAEGIVLADGDYVWRVGAVEADGSVTGFTPPRTFTVLKPLAVPVVTAPSAESEVVVYGGSPVTVAWESVFGADYYNVRVFASNGSLALQAESERGTDAQFVLAPDTYTLALQAVADETETSPFRVGAWSELQFTVRAPSPVEPLQPADGEHIRGLTALREPLLFHWHDGKDASVGYEFELYKTQTDGSSKLLERIASEVPAVEIKRLTEGNYRWRVRASTADGLPLDSEERTFTIESVSELSRPSLTAPASALVMDFDYLRKNRTITFSWLPVSEATDYTFTLYKKGNGTLIPVYSEKNLKTTSVRIKKLSLLEVGAFTWTVTAFTHAKDGYEEQHSRAASRDFTVSFDRPQKVQTIQPERMYAE